MSLAYLQAAVEPDADGGLRLRCPGAVESRIYREVSQAGAFAYVPDVTAPTVVFGGDLAGDPHAGWTAPFMRDVARAMANARSETMVNNGHLMVMEAPDTCADAIVGRYWN